MAAEGPLDGGPLDSPPGLVTPLDPLANDPRRSYARELLDQAEDLAAGVEETLYASVDGKLAGAQRVKDQVHAVINGRAGTLLDKAQQLAAKPVAKVTKTAQQLLDNAYAYAHQAGVRTPIMDDVLHGLTTGDYLGSVGFGPKPAGGTDAAQIAGPTLPGPAARDPLPPPAPTPPPGTTPAAPFRPEPVTLPPGWECPSYAYPIGSAEFGYFCYHVESGRTEPPTWVGPGTPPGGTGGSGPGGPVPPLQIPPALADCPTLKSWNYAGTWSGAGPVQTAYGRAWRLLPEPDWTPAGWPFESAGQVLWSQVQWLPNSPVNPQLRSHAYAPKGWNVHVDPHGVAWTAPPNGLRLPLACVSYRPTDRPPGGTGGPGGTIVTEGPDGPQCVTPAAPECGPDSRPVLPPQVDVGDRCKAIEEAIAKAAAQNPDLRSLFQMKTAAQDPSFWTTGGGRWVTGLVGAEGPALPTVAARLAAWLQKQLEAVVHAMGCDSEKLLPVSLIRAAYQVIDKWTGAIPEQVMEEIRQVSNTVCQSLLPSGSEADAAYLANAITKEVWECWHKAQGDLVGPADQVLTAQRTRLDWMNASLARRREKVTLPRWEQLMREAGVITPEDRQELFDSTQAWPQLADVIRFMVRDVADDKAVERGKLDEDFEKKWAGLLEKYGEGLGVGRDLARYYWRAHWQIPSFTQLSEMLHRLRPGRVPKELETTEETVREALKQDDHAPAYVDRLMYISHHTITRTDLQVMYLFRVVETDDLVERLMDFGYLRKDAELLAEQWKRRRKKDEAVASGMPSPRYLVREYARGEVSDDDLREAAELVTPTPEMADRVVEAAHFARRNYGRKQRIAAVKRQYVACLIGEDEAHGLLSEADVDPGAASELVEHWSIIRKCRGKEVSASQLCTWYQDGLITPAALAAGIKRAGYSADQVAIMVTACQHKLAEKRRKAEEAALKAAAAAAERARKAEERRLKELAKCAPKPCPPDRPSVLDLLADQADGDGEATPGAPGPAPGAAGGTSSPSPAVGGKASASRPKRGRSSR